MSSLCLDNIGNRVGSLAIPIDTVLQGTAKAWLNMNGTGTIAIRDSFNVSSITDNGTGDYTMTFAAAQPNANYGFQQTVGDATTQLVPAFISGSGIQTTTAFRSQSRYISSLAGSAITQDCSYFQASIHGDPV